MATETTRVSSYMRSEGFLDSAGTRYQNASAVNNLVSGLTTSVNASSLVNLVSGLATGVNASSLNDIISGLTVSAGQLNFASGFPASAAYAVSAGTAANATTAATAAAATTALAAASASYAASAGALSGVSAVATEINTLLYGTKYKTYFGSTIASDTVVVSTVTNMGISTALFAFVTPQVTGIIAGAIATQTGIQWSIVASEGTATQATVQYLVVGNE